MSKILKQVQLCNIKFINVYSLNFIRLVHFDQYQKERFYSHQFKIIGKVIKTVCKYCINTSKKTRRKKNKKVNLFVDTMQQVIVE